MTSATVIRNNLAETVTELDRVVTMVSTADSHARTLRSMLVDLGVIDLPVMVDDLRQRIDDATKQLTSARQILQHCAGEVQRVIIGANEVPEQALAPAPLPPPKNIDPPTATPTPTPRRQPAHAFDWLRVRMLMSVAACVFAVAAAVLDSWLHLVRIRDDVYMPVVGAIVLTAVSVGHLDRRRVPRPAEIAVAQLFGVALVSSYLIRDVIGSHDLTVSSVAAAIGVLLLNTVIGIVVLPRHRRTGGPS